MHWGGVRVPTGQAEMMSGNERRGFVGCWQGSPSPPGVVNKWTWARLSRGLSSAGLHLQNGLNDLIFIRHEVTALCENTLAPLLFPGQIAGCYCWPDDHGEAIPSCYFLIPLFCSCSHAYKPTPGPKTPNPTASLQTRTPWGSPLQSKHASHVSFYTSFHLPLVFKQLIILHMQNQ